MAKYIRSFLLLKHLSKQHIHVPCPTNIMMNSNSTQIVTATENFFSVIQSQLSQLMNCLIDFIMNKYAFIVSTYNILEFMFAVDVVRGINMVRYIVAIYTRLTSLIIISPVIFLSTHHIYYQHLHKSGGLHFSRNQKDMLLTMRRF